MPPGRVSADRLKQPDARELPVTPFVTSALAAIETAVGADGKVAYHLQPFGFQDGAEGFYKSPVSPVAR